MKKTIALLLVIFVAFSVCSCAKSTELDGEWTAKIDITENFNNFLEKYAYDFSDLVPKEKIEKHIGDFRVEECIYVADFKLENGKMTLTTTIQDSDKMCDKLRPVWHAIMDEMLIVLGMGAEGSSEQMFSGELGFDAFFNNVTSVIAKEQSGEFSLKGDKLIFNDVEFATVDKKNTNNIVLNITDGAKDMFKSETYYVIELKDEWVLNRR